MNETEKIDRLNKKIEYLESILEEKTKKLKKGELRRIQWINYREGYNMALGDMGELGKITFDEFMEYKKELSELEDEKKIGKQENKKIGKRKKIVIKTSDKIIDLFDYTTTYVKKNKVTIKSGDDTVDISKVHAIFIELDRNERDMLIDSLFQQKFLSKLGVRIKLIEEIKLKKDDKG